MKKFPAIILIICILCTLLPSAAAGPAADKYGNCVSEEYMPGYERCVQIYETLSEYFSNPVAVCSIMGNMARESRMCPWRYEGDDSESYAVSKAFAEVVNSDLKAPTRETRYYFSKFAVNLDNRTGFGLCQWTALGRKELLYDMAVETGLDIDDVTLQCQFLIWEMQVRYTELTEMMEEQTDSLLCLQYFMNGYEKAYSNMADLYRRHEAAEEFLCLFAPEYASLEKYKELSADELLEILDIVE